MMAIRLVILSCFGCVFVTTSELSVRADAIGERHAVVVKLFGAGVGNLDSYGSGTLISETGHVVTVWNHLVNTGYLTAVTHDGRRFAVDVVGTNAEYDVAVIKLQCESDETFPCVDLSESRDVSVGVPVLAFSNMYRVATGNEPVSVVHGMIAAKSPLKAGFGRWEFPVRDSVYIIDAITNNSGAAGGLLTTYDGIPVALIGRELRHRETDMWVNYAVPLTTLRPVLSALIAGERFKTSPRQESSRMLSDRQLTAEYGLTLLPDVIQKTPAYVDGVTPNSVAAGSGFQRGDLIVLANEEVIQSVQEFRRLLAGLRPGQRLSVTVSRNGQLLTLSIP